MNGLWPGEPSNEPPSHPWQPSPSQFRLHLQQNDEWSFARRCTTPEAIPRERSDLAIKLPTATARSSWLDPTDTVTVAGLPDHDAGHDLMNEQVSQVSWPQAHPAHAHWHRTFCPHGLQATYASGLDPLSPVR